MSLNEKDYKKYLCQAYYIKTGQKLNLKHPKTLNEKIQWLKLFDNKQQKSELTDKVLVRNWVREKIGDEYLKPVLWIGDKFDDIPFDSLPFSFVVKCNHGCKWHFIINNKQEFLKNIKLFNVTKTYMDNWLKQSFFGWSDFETQYLNIKPKIIIENLIRNSDNSRPDEFEVYCFNGYPKLIKTTIAGNRKFVCYFDEKFSILDITCSPLETKLNIKVNDFMKEALELSKKLSQGFKFNRVDWMITDNKLYFGEITFSPNSGFLFFENNNNVLQTKYGKLINLKGD